MISLKVFIALVVSVSLSDSISLKDQIPLRDGRSSPFTSDFDAETTRLMKNWDIPGLSIAVVDGNETYSKGYGVSLYPPFEIEPSTLFYTGSTTKAFTSAALTLLMEESANTSDPLTWRTPISSLIREDFVLSDEYATAHVTLEDAASHRTGMPRHDSSYGGPNFGLRHVVRNLRNLPMTAEIRTRSQYCNMMYMTLSHVVETLTGSWLGDVLWDRIWKPLNMTRTYFSLSQAQLAVENGAGKLSGGHVWNNHTQKYIPVAWMDIPLVSGAGHVISNVLDYAKWLQFLMDQAPPLSKAGHRTLRHPRIVLDDMPIPGYTGISAYALGWNVDNYRGEPLISHDGGLPGFGARIGYLPDRRYGIALMGNTAGSSNIVENILFFRLLDDHMNVPKKDRGDIAAVFKQLLIQPQIEKIKDPIKFLYPKAPTGKDAVPLSKPLKNYAGTYWNEGYRDITITLAQYETESSYHLHSAFNRTWPFVLDFEHVSGEYFIAKGYMSSPLGEVDKSDPLNVIFIKAEFRLGEDGEVAEVGAALEPEMKEEKIWFKRVEETEKK
ncbi:MAG: hypothetical protein Q9166_000875 [cf. Caloplaca sp. 2 TL-2023]